MPCPSSKRAYPNEITAENALIEARIRFENNKAVGIYLCNECGQWHLTSTGQVNTRLQELLNNGSLKKEREALLWEMKLRSKFS